MRTLTILALVALIIASFTQSIPATCDNSCLCNSPSIFCSACKSTPFNKIDVTGLRCNVCPGKFCSVCSSDFNCVGYTSGCTNGSLPNVAGSACFLCNVTGCTNCFADNFCEKCATNFTLNRNLGTCSANPPPSPNPVPAVCISPFCTQCDSFNSVIRCLACIPNFLQNQILNECFFNSVAGCQFANSHGVCAACASGLTLTTNNLGVQSCTASPSPNPVPAVCISPFCTQCDSFNSVIRCLACIPNFLQNQTLNGCFFNRVAGCKFANSHGVCSLCSNDVAPTFQGGVQVCNLTPLPRSRFYPIPSNAIPNTSNCPPWCSACYIVNGANKCYACANSDSNFYPTSDFTACLRSLVPNCVFSSLDQSDRCSKCESSPFNNVLINC